MLSVENPPVPDPPCACTQFPQLNTSSSSSDDDDDKKASSLNQKQQQQLDLPKPPPPLDDQQRTPLPNFSIRDYVFTARSKDIRKNWPFSLKNLQLCLKHGVKEVLPPFEPFDSVRNKSLKRCLVETDPSEKQQTISHKELSGEDNNLVVLDSSHDARLNTKLAEESCADVSSCRSGEENDFPSTTTSLSASEIESRQPSSRLETTETSLKASVEVERPGPSSVFHKAESSARAPVGKKCKLVVKFGGHSDRGSPEDIASNCSVVSETMTSKVCPVCKTFSSSSNTTLNAHIDQCLSAESTPKWTADTKVTRHRIKPRKTRLMVDIYATARHCTLEELDQRNGTSWATVSRLPAHQEEPEKVETCNEGKKQKPEVAAGDVGPVYIDSSGTKVRILSKLNDSSPVTKVREDVAARKSLKACKPGKYIAKKKKKRLAHKHQKYLKHGTHNKSFSSPMHGSQIGSSQAEGHDGEGRTSEIELKIPKQNGGSDSGTLRPWICSKRRGITKKITSQDGHQPTKRKWHVPKLYENDQSSLPDSLPADNHDQQRTNPITIGGNNDRLEMSSHGAQVNDRQDCFPRRKRVGSFVAGSRTIGKVERSLRPMKKINKQVTKGGNSLRDNHMLKPPSASRSHVPLLRKKTVDAHKDFSSNSSVKASRSSRAIVTKAMRFSSFRKNLLSASRESSAAECRPSLKQWSIFRKSQVHSVSERDDEVLAQHCEVNQQAELLDNHSGSQSEREDVNDEVCLSRSTILGMGKEARLSFASDREEALSLKSLKSGSHCYDHDERAKLVSVGVITDFDCLDSAGEPIQVHEEIVSGPYPKVYDGRSTTSLSESIDTEFYKLSNSSRAQSNSFRSVEDYEGLLCGTDPATDPTAEPNFDNDQEMFSAYEAGNGVMRQNDHMEMEMDSEVGQATIFPEVDPIPIPGPPGSFLPSPRDMSSEDFQGNSSLTSSRVHSSPDQRDMIDGESSDSPISAASTVSNSMAGGQDFRNSEPSSSAGPYAIGEKIRSSFVVTGIEPSMQKAGEVSQTINRGVERGTNDGGYFKLDRISIEKGSLSMKNDQPCCCQRKERFSQSVDLNHQESQLLRRRKMAPMMVPAVGKPIACNPIGKPIACNPNLRPSNYLDVSPEVVPLGSCPTLGSTQKMVTPVRKPAGGSVSFKDSPNTGVRYPGRGDCDSASPSGSNPILRLMGKNLMVVNKDEDASVAVEHVQSGTQNIHQISGFPTFSAGSPGNNQGQGCQPIHHMVPQGSIVFGVDPHNPVSQRFDVGLSSSFGSDHGKLPQGSAQLPSGMFRSHCADRGFSASMGLHEYKGDYNFPSQQTMLKSRLSMSPRYDMVKTTTVADHPCKRADSSSHPIREIIIIDDLPESGSRLTSDAAKYPPQVWRESQTASSGISNPTVPVYNPSCMHPAFPCYQSQEPSPFGGESPVVFPAGFHATPSGLPNASPVRWGCTPEGTVVVPRSPFTAAPSSSGHLRSTTLHYGTGFS
ncbi:hypothetical protein Tsubulata_012943 [Turnera subulata]|uniref:Hapless 8 n=1 Tax=Turnera subulata TaxID=218843 RepID=A0A9Q0JPG7_9ROSI|nr:hypothetical protein Tsubulata_012943 [Turnera subulata]